MKALYKYPQAEYPYAQLVDENRQRGLGAPELELIDTGVFNEDRYFDVSAEYTKGSQNDILIRITIANRGPEPAVLHLLPTLWFRNTWSWAAKEEAKPLLRASMNDDGIPAIVAQHSALGERWFICDRHPELLFTENETNAARLFGTQNSSPFVKDGINDYVVNSVSSAVNPEH